MYAATAMPSPSTVLLAWATRVFSLILLLNVPSEFWTQVLALMDVPKPVVVLVSPFIGSTCATIVEVINDAIKAEQLRRAGLVAENYHDPTAKYWPLKIFVGSMAGLLCMSLFSPGIIAIIPKATDWAIGFIGGAAGYWFVSTKLPQLLDQTDKKKDDEPQN